jgi:hypothetical protein
MRTVPGSLSRGRRIRNVALSGALLVVLVTGIQHRTQVVKYAPWSHAAFRAIGLPVNTAMAEFRNVRARTVSEGPDTRIVIEGEIANFARGLNAVPDVQMSLIGERGELAYSWVVKLPEKKIKQGEKLAFTAGLDSPPAGKLKVAVIFAK